MSFRARDPEPDADRGPVPPAGAVPEPVRRAIDRVASWMQAELGLIMSGVRAMTRDVNGMVAEVKDVFAALSTRLAAIETRLAQTSLTQLPEGDSAAPPPASPSRCRRRAHRRRRGGGRCRGLSRDH